MQRYTEITDKHLFEKSSWREYQRTLKREAKKRSTWGFLKYTSVFIFMFMAVIAVLGGLNSNADEPVYAGSASGKTEKPETLVNILSQETYEETSMLDKKGVKRLLSNLPLKNFKKESFEVENNGEKYQIDTTVDIDLQNYISDKIKEYTSRKRYVSKQIGFVAMDPYSGKIRAMVGFNENHKAENTCINSEFPAASVFKIITAAAVIEKYGMNSDSKLNYSGRKYSLYKSQLKKKINKYSHVTTLRKSFALSINPVFGRLGKLLLGQTVLEQYAKAFGFNRDINFELDFDPSVITVTNEPFNWAEIACGFNRETTISPVHGALMASVVLNNGILVEPTIVDRLTDHNGRVLYRSHFTPINQAITPHASVVLADIMKETIKSGTLRKAFRGYKKDRVLSRLRIGGKSGSIKNKTRTAYIDWFVGYAHEKKGDEKLVVSVVVAHGKYRGVRAAHYAREAMKRYFGAYFAQNDSDRKKTKS